MLYRIGYEIGGTNTKAVCVSIEEISDKNFELDQQLIVVENTVKGKGKAEAFVAQLIKMGEEALKRANASKSNIEGIGIGSPGPMNSTEGLILNSPNFEGIGIVQVITPLKDHFGAETYLENDVSTAALGEKYLGVGKTHGCENLVVITSGTGLGGGVIVNGQMPTGYMGNFAEIGHTIVEYGSEARADGCTPDNPQARGHWEAYCAASWFGRWAGDETKEMRTSTDPKDILLYQMAKDRLGDRAEENEEQIYNNVRAGDVFGAYKKGDALAVKLVDSFREYHARGLNTVITCFNPEYITLMGSLHLNNSDLVLHNLRPDGSKEENHLAKRALKYCYRRTTMKPESLILTPLGYDIGLYGALALVDEKRK